MVNIPDNHLPGSEVSLKAGKDSLLGELKLPNNIKTLTIY
jgi:hypothetical protein